MPSKAEPSWTLTKEKPPLESRRVRTHPLTVTVSPAATLPRIKSTIAWSDIGGFLSADVGQGLPRRAAIVQSLKADGQSVRPFRAMGGPPMILFRKTWAGRPWHA